MDTRSPFFQNHHNWAHPHPYHQRQQQQQQPAQKSSRVISIPVHFVQSEATRSSAALKIQKAARGFLVRKSLKRILAVRREVEEIERWLGRRENVEVVRRVEKERIRVSETLMGLLLKLDSVRGAGNGAVRDCRKAVIKKAIALQEGVENLSSEQIGGCEKTLGKSVASEWCVLQQNIDVASEGMGDDDDKALQESVENQIDELNALDAEVEAEEPKTIHCMTDCSVEEGPKAMELVADGACGPEEEEVKVEGVKMDIMEEWEEKKRRSRELLERMAEENERLVGMVTQLTERNETQTKLLSSLTQRVEQLEKAFVTDMLMRKKKKLGKKQ